MLRSAEADVEAVSAGCCFGRGAVGFNNWDRVKKQLDAAINKKLAPWTLHDIRRTVATRMGDLGVQPHIIEATLNHISGHRAGVAGIYQRSTYSKEKRAALDTWASHLTTLLAQAEGANVVELNLARK